MSAALAAAALVWANALTPPTPFDESALVFRFTVTPAAVPTPKLRYELLPPHRERTPGNAAIDYLRAAVLLPKPPRYDADEFRARLKEQQRWSAFLLDRLPLARMKAELKLYEKALTAADRTARLAK